MSAVTNAVALSVAMPILANAWAAQPPRQVESVLTGAGPVSVDLFVGGLEHPWALAFLPDGRLLVTERPGRLRIIGKDGRLSDPVAGTPDVFARGQRPGILKV